MFATHQGQRVSWEGNEVQYASEVASTSSNDQWKMSLLSTQGQAAKTVHEWSEQDQK
jgi:hypothetical protein